MPLHALFANAEQHNLFTMNHDSLHKTIVEALAAGGIDGNEFERCAQDLLGDVYPNLSPVVGGSDAGMDGALGTHEGMFPLICTVRLDVIGNFRKNIETRIRSGHKPKLALIATTQSLSTAKRQNLEKEAGKLGVILVNIHEAAYFADRLYRHSQWRLRLLGITGDPSALSIFPRVSRLVQPETLVGREADINWLKQSPGDLLITGQPGSGKTYLHQHLASQGFCLFAVDSTRSGLAEAIRSQSPSVIVVDDAHLNLELIHSLQQLRSEIGASYCIHANCWPNQSLHVQKQLAIPTASIRELKRLNPKEIIRLIEALGIVGPDWLLHLLLDQCDGKPGLAVALVDCCKTEDISRIWTGEAAAERIVGDRRLVRGELEKCALAAFALGGKAGMTFRDVSSALRLSEIELKQVIADLGAGGLVEEIFTDRLQVRPASIRPILVRNVFFRGPAALNITPVLNVCQSASDTASVLFAAEQRGANIDHDILEHFAIAADNSDTWEHFAWIDNRCAAIVLDKCPDKVCHAAPGLLQYFPERTIQMLLDVDEVNTVIHHGSVIHPRRRIAEWLFPVDSDPYETVRRRTMLLTVLENRISNRKVGNGRTLAWALAELLCAAYERTRTIPGDDRTFQLLRGVASHEVIDEIAGLWPRIRNALTHVSASEIHLVFKRLEDWCIPQRLSINKPLPKQTHSMIKQHGQRMLVDMLTLSKCNRAWLTKAAGLARWADMDINIEVDPAFDAIYADHEYSTDWQTAETARMNRLRSIAQSLADKHFSDVVGYLDGLEAEATELGYENTSSRMCVVYSELSKLHSTSAFVWIDELIKHNSRPEYVATFVDQVRSAEQQFQLLLSQMLNMPIYRRLAITRVLQISKPDQGLLRTALDLLTDNEIVDRLWLRDESISADVMLRLLTHSNPRLRGKAAISEWDLDPAHSIRPTLVAAWRAAVLDAQPREYALQEILSSEPMLAFQWLFARLTAKDIRFHQNEMPIANACRLLTFIQRRELVRLIDRRSYEADFFDLLIGDELELFRDWLRFQTDKYLALRPLQREVGLRWEHMATIALDEGVTSDELCTYCIPNSWGDSEHLDKQILAYERLANHTDHRLRPVGRHGLAWAHRERKVSKMREEFDKSN
jgi:hypothetical protein